MASKQSKKIEKRKMLEYSILCALFIKQIRKISDEDMNNWFMVMNRTEGFCDEFALLFRDMVKKCLFDEYEKRKSKGVKK